VSPKGKEAEKRKEKRKKVESKMSSGADRKLRNAPDPGSFRRRRRFLTSKPLADLHCIQHILDANRLTWSDVGHHPDCQFASFIHASQQQEPNLELIIDTRRSCRSWLRLNPQMISFLKRGRKGAMNIPSSNEKGG
jgi:hypothetical protein